MFEAASPFASPSSFGTSVTGEGSVPARAPAAVRPEELLFREAAAAVRAKSPASFDPWFSGVQFEGLIDGVLALRARDEFVREWVDAHFLPMLVARLREETGWSMQVAWIVGGAIERPVASDDRKASAPIRPRPLASTPPTGFPPARVSSFPQEMRTDAAPVSQRPSQAPPASLPPLAPPNLNAKYTFGTYVVGPSNQLAHAASIAASGGGGPRHNPLFLCGSTGLGKTHLMHAIAHRIREERPDVRIIYVSAESFMNDFVESLKEGKTSEFRARYRDRCDVLLVDDVQFLAGKTQTQEEFFHVFNALHERGKTIVLSSDKYPAHLERMEERLVSRFSAGLVADIQGPELETRVAIVRKKAEIEEVDLAPEVVLFLAQSVRQNVRELEGTLIRLAAKSSLLGISVDLEFAKRELFATGSVARTETSIEDIQRAVCHHFKLKASDLTSKDRHKSIAFARHVAMYLCKTRLKCSLPELGRAFGGRDHTTVLAAVRKVDGLRATSSELRAHLDVLETRLGA